MTSIHKLNHALSVARQTLTELRAQKGALTAPVPVPNTAQGIERTSNVRRKMKERLRALDFAKNEDRERGAVVFFETILADEFGAELLADPAFYNLLADIKKTILADPETHTKFFDMLGDVKGSD